MIIERFKNQDPVPVYRRFRDRGRLAPEGLRYVSSWVEEKLERYDIVAVFLSQQIYRQKEQKNTNEPCCSG